MIEASQALFSLETLIITVSAGAVAALVVGFVTGYCCGRRCHKDDNTLVSIGLYFRLRHICYRTHLIPGLPVPQFLSPWTNDPDKIDPPAQMAPIKFSPHGQMVPKYLGPQAKWSPN